MALARSPVPASLARQVIEHYLEALTVQHMKPSTAARKLADMKVGATLLWQGYVQTSDRASARRILGLPNAKWLSSRRPGEMFVVRRIA